MIRNGTSDVTLDDWLVGDSQRRECIARGEYVLLVVAAVVVAVAVSRDIDSADETIAMADNGSSAQQST